MALNNRAQAGVGTLIIFITLVLVAGIAASLLVQTSSKLQHRASATGEQAVKEVSTKVSVQSVAGYSQTPSSGKIDKLILTASLGPKSEDIRLSDIVLSYQSGDIYIASITYNSSAESLNGAADFYSSVVQGNGNEVLEQGEILELHFWIEDSTACQLNASTEFSMAVAPKRGSPSTVKALTPSTLLYNYVTLQ